MAYRGAGLLIATRVDTGWEVLLGRRRRKPFCDCWSTPGGERDADDACFRDTACRETAEEICGHRPVEDFFRVWLADGFKCNHMPEHRHWLPFLSEWYTFLLELTGKAEPRRISVPNYEFSAVAWFPARRLPNPTHPGVDLSSHHFGLSGQRMPIVDASLGTLRMARILIWEKLHQKAAGLER